jgi:uncharacterized iron-regulated protein
MGRLIRKRRLRRLIYLLVCVFGIVAVCTQSVNAQITNTCRPQVVVPEQSNRLDAIINYASADRNCKNADVVTTPLEVLPKLAQANVVYLGETHDRPEDGKLQLDIIQELQRRNAKVAIAMEMFQLPYQGAIDRYLADKLSEQELVEQTEYDKRWGYPWEYYAPILRFAKAKQLPVLALNTPSEITRQVAKEGLESLTPQQRKIIPPASEIRTDNAEYRQMLAKIFQQHQHGGQGNSRGFDRFFLAQVLWDETMAAEIAQFVKTNPQYQIVVLAGKGHIIYDYGIPSRVARRMQNRQFLQFSVLLSPAKDSATDSKKPIADYVWQ